jgi:hypothetical protein
MPSYWSKLTVYGGVEGTGGDDGAGGSEVGDGDDGWNSVGMRMCG